MYNDVHKPNQYIKRILKVVVQENSPEIKTIMKKCAYWKTGPRTANIEDMF